MLARFCVPFVNNNYPNSHLLMMDNATIHTSPETNEFLLANNLNHFPTPPQSPDLNPIGIFSGPFSFLLILIQLFNWKELVWNDMKVYIKNIVKPTTKQQLINGILYFWTNIVTVAYCNSKIDHLAKVIQLIIRLKGLGLIASIIEWSWDSCKILKEI